ncbi:MAG: hypothetical protein MZV65_31905 [Chromatiales bacterium]|nr:hypothetical protein [Chromatiales bacterium]
MTHDMETAVATVIGACLSLDHLVELSHSIRPLRTLPPGTDRARTRPGRS